MTFVAAASIYAVLLCFAILFVVGASKVNEQYDATAPQAMPQNAALQGASQASAWDAAYAAAWATARDASDDVNKAAWAQARDAQR